ncbi:JAB domain-containing protein [Aegicerativicinus sediminis]|uniref:JAB domain-containing protein n=1 Tax=Aegicerativicinus sediminis TaxID=2893202 RepID=UPI001E4A01B2|nr:JAB domain-containing protein [Aegicerativicinus sediminis]
MKHTISEITVGYTPNKMVPNFKITCSVVASNFIRDQWDHGTFELQEEFKVLLLNNSNEPLGIYPLSKGGMTYTGVDLRILFGVILKSGATAFISVHNHPSGKMKPSNADFQLHNKMKEISELFGINFLDNLILSKEAYYSFMEDGY